MKRRHKGIWTEKQLEALVADPRKMKKLEDRKPKTGLSVAGLNKEISKRTDFKVEHVGEITRALMAIITETMLKGEFVKLGKIGHFYPVLNRARPGMNLKGGDKIDINDTICVPPRWVLKFNQNQWIKDAFLDKSVSMDQIENMYTDAIDTQRISRRKQRAALKKMGYKYIGI